jgi:hypothetical protein
MENFQIKTVPFISGILQNSLEITPDLNLQFFKLCIVKIVSILKTKTSIILVFLSKKIRQKAEFEFYHKKQSLPFSATGGEKTR